MSYEPPTPPGDLPERLVESLRDQSPGSLRQVARYADSLAEYHERQDRLRDEDGDGDADVNDEASDADAVDVHRRDHPDNKPSDVPSKATITIKEINDNRYYYWQWREGDKIRSQYEGPVETDQ